MPGSIASPRPGGRGAVEAAVDLRDVYFRYRLRASPTSSPNSPLPEPGAKGGRNAGANGSGPGRGVGGNLLRGSGRNLEVEALGGISLRIMPGERVGITGRNGAGKSTLLRVIAGIYPPSAGAVRTRGRVSAIMGQGHGMDGTLSGYENIVLRGLFLGFSRRQIRRRLPEIAEFSELGDYLDLPIRAYSPGMKMRLSFAVSTCFEPDVLVLDEWLSAGDKAFMTKATERMSAFVDSASTFVLVTHNMRLIEKTCDRLITMERGRITEDGPLWEDQA
ncbi:MAG: ABC transporter ATP-binding protein [Planctomycetota bacterium]